MGRYNTFLLIFSVTILSLCDVNEHSKQEYEIGNHRFTGVVQSRVQSLQGSFGLCDSSV